MEVKANLMDPAGSDRVSAVANLVVWYSLKNNRRVYCTGLDRANVCIALECDPAVRRYNEVPASQQIPIAPGRSVSVRPLAVAQSADRPLQVHLVNRNEGEEAATQDFLEGSVIWAQGMGAEVFWWTSEMLAQFARRHANYKQLLRYISYPTYTPDPSRKSQLADLLVRRPYTTVMECVAAFGEDSEDLTLQAIADHIVSGTLLTDLDDAPFTYRSTLCLPKRA